MAAGAVVLAAAALYGLDVASRGGQWDFLAFYEAAVAARRGEDIYAAGVRGYIYPPLLAFLLQPLAGLSFRQAAVAWTLVNIALIPLAVALALREVARRFDVTPSPGTLLAAGGLTLTVLADKIGQELRQGNCNLLVILAFVLALTWLGRRPLLCGLALGFAINIKYLPVVFLPYLAARRRYRELGAAVAAAAAFALLPAVSFGWTRTVEYLGVATHGLDAMARGQVAAGAAQIRPLTWNVSVSIPSTLARLLAALGASPSLTIPLTAVVAGAMLAGAGWLYARAGVRLFASRTGASDDRTADGRALVALEWAALTAAAVLLSPQTTPRHLNLALPLVALAAGLVLFPRRDSLRRPVVIGLAVFFLGLVLPPGARSLRGGVEAWRAVGGMSWCLTVLCFTTLYVGLREVVASRARAGSGPEAALRPEGG